MIKALFSSASGLRVHEELLNVTGNNLANVNTTAFKSQRARFADILSQQIRGASAPGGGIGGVNPLQVGLGAQVASIDANFAQGGLNPTGKELDLTLQGNGFFVVRHGTEELYTRAGAFTVDRDNYLVDTATGARVQRTGSIGEGSATDPVFQTPGNNDILLPFGSNIPGIATTNITLKGNLDSTATGPTLITGAPLTVAGAAAVGTTLLDNLDTNTVNYIAGDTITINGSVVNNAGVTTAIAATYTYAVGDDLSDLITAINGAYNAAGVTASLDANGNIVLEPTASLLGADVNTISLTLADGGGNTGATSWNNHALTFTAGQTKSTSIQVYDTQGTAHVVNITFRKKLENVWDAEFAIDPSEGTIVAGTNYVEGITFDPANGAFVGVTDLTPRLQINWNFNPAATQTVDFSFGTTGGFNGLTQFGGFESAAAIAQDGFASGGLTSVSVDQNGIIVGKFENGRQLNLAQIAIALFSNPEGLTREGGNYFDATTNSGTPLISTALTEGRGFITSKNLELSNVDIGVEFTQLITAQRGYQINARALSIASDTIQSLTQVVQ